MQTRIPLSLFGLILAACAAFAQQSDTEAAARLKEQRRAILIAKVAADADQLKLSENRAILSSRLGAVVWKSDQEQGKKLFEAAVSELNAAQQEAEAAKRNAHLFNDLLNSQNIRPQILNTIASVDPQYALESLYRTRPTNVARAMAGEASEKVDDQGHNRGYIAQAEVNLEQRLLRMVADKNPEKAEAILRDMISKRLSNVTHESLRKLYSLDGAAANGLANDVLARLNSAAFISNGQPVNDLLQLSSSIIADHIRERSPDEKSLTFNDSAVRSLAIKLLGTYIQNVSRIGYLPLDQLEPITRKYAPAQLDRLRKAAESTRYGWGGRRPLPTNPEYDEFMKSDPSADQLVQNAGRFSPDVQRQLYQSAANKFSEAGLYQNALTLLNAKFDGEALENAVSSLNSNYANYLMNKGDFDTAEATMLEFHENLRVSALTSLAQAIFNRNPAENKNRAAGVLRRVRLLLPQNPETNNDINQLFAFINATALIDPSESFATLEPLIDQINTLTHAFSIVQAYQGGQMRHGEYQLAGGMNFGVHVDQTMFRSLSIADFERTNALIDSLSRLEMRISIRLYLAENL